MVRAILTNLLSVVLLWAWGHWRPEFRFSNRSFKDMFGFGSRLLASSLLNTIFENVYYVVIGKIFSSQILGYYTRASAFAQLPSSNISTVVQRVSFPVLATLQDNKIQLRSAFRRILKSTMFISFVLMLGLSAIAEPLILTLIGNKWRPSIIILQLLSFALATYPLHSLNLNILTVLGRSDLFLKLEIIKKMLIVPTVIVAIVWGIKMLLISMIINSIISFFINTRYSQRLIGYSAKDQIADVMPSFLVASSSCIAVYSVGFAFRSPVFALLVIQLLLGMALVISISEVFKLDAYVEIKKIFIMQTNKILKKGNLIK